ncbi:MAG: DUF2345 domain-containing protein, partial [Stenotrophomonas sp.]
IDVLAKSKIVLQAGSSAITLEGGDITFSCPGEFKVKAGEHPFLGGSSDAPALPALPAGLYSFKESLRFALEGSDALAADLGWKGKPFRITDADGKEVTSGTLGEDGRLPRVMADGLGRPLTLQVGEDTWDKIVSSAGLPPENDGDNPDFEGVDPFLGQPSDPPIGSLTSEQILELLNESPAST